ncbi:Exodeoxyribonuclease I [Granulosicoccus antarcticus IMCC3135]|uniref:Exodeoxyribonuclease I n=1 Tax=Granulosicoccus antarcticus IMCC3135 TaxID=1192854 RepID=A0A2Z2P339_9GAMM|nr:Exodeoxyribonuclease I [Granulosicoccus antarcticus IMCC3135]
MSFYWFDYETFGTQPAWDRPCQFAGVRTDEDLNVIGEPMTLYCRQSEDYLPQPAACRVTGITPQLANEKGLCEAHFIQRILDEIGAQDTCSVGYNSIRFDDEFTRHTLFRNLQDPYEQEWKNGNSRWDLIDVVRLTRALRPEGIQWPFHEDGSASNRLEDLSAINGIEHGQAHDAMSDVWATIGMAKLIRDTQPRLFNHVFSHRGKASVAQLLNPQERTVRLQVSGMVAGSRHNVAAILPLSKHPDNANGVIVLDLQDDPRYLLELDADEIARRLYQPASERKDTDAPRPGLRTVQINKCPVIVPLSTLRPVDAERLQINRAQIDQHAAWAQEVCNNEHVLEQIRRALSRQWQDDSKIDVDGTLYSGAFLSSSDKKSLQTIRKLSPEKLALKLEQVSGHFDDKRLDAMVWRYLARSFPDALTPEQSLRWQQECVTRLSDNHSAWLGYESYQQALDEIEWTPAERELQQALNVYSLQLQST